MRLRRAAGSGALQFLRDDAWMDLEGSGVAIDEALSRLLRPTRFRDAAVGTQAFDARSYRDFMLYERHFVQAGRGYLKRFRPAVARIADGYRRITGGVFPPLRPKPLWYREPIYYKGNHLSFVGDGATIPWPDYTDALDYELELGFVLKHGIVDASPEEAKAAIGAFVVFNDFSARDIQVAEMDSGFGPQKSKDFCSAMSAELATADELLPFIDELEGRVVIDGEIVARCSSAGMRFSLGEVLAHASRAERLHAGEFFATGTWPDGSGMETATWLRPGQTIRLEIDGVGSVENVIGRRSCG